jgi:hypothetical protein
LIGDVLLGCLRNEVQYTIKAEASSMFEQ